MTRLCGCSLGRREFIATGLAAAAALPARRALAQAAVKRIDVHHHFLPPQYMKEEHERINFGHGGVSTSQMLSWTPSQSLEIMDNNGVATAIVCRGRDTPSRKLAEKPAEARTTGGAKTVIRCRKKMLCRPIAFLCGWTRKCSFAAHSPGFRRPV